MRKLLLATVAALGASMGVATIADAQTASPAPGTVTVRLNGRFRFYAFGAFDRDADNNLAGTATGTVPQGGTNKQTNYGFGEYARLYPGFDGVAANGLKYGASLEIRQDQYSGAGGGAFGGISQSNRARAGLYFRREWGYIGTDQFGTVRLGNSDQPTSLYMTGNFENFNDGGWNGDVPGLISQNIAITWPFQDVGNYYATSKVTYLSPQFFGFDFGVSFEPSTAGLSINNNCNGSNPVGTNFVTTGGTAFATNAFGGAGVSGPGCDRLSSSPSNAESARRKNTIDALIRYRGTFGGFGIAATAAIIRGSNVKDNAGVPFNSDFRAGGVRNNFQGLEIGDFGVALTYAGFSVGGKFMYGKVNGQWSLLPQGLPAAEAWIIGASYTIGPVIVGAHWIDYKSAGDQSSAVLGRQRREQGLAVGGTYSLAPGVSIFASYLWGQRKQNGYNFITSSSGITAAARGGDPNNNKVQSQLVSIGTSFSW